VRTDGSGVPCLDAKRSTCFHSRRHVLFTVKTELHAPVFGRLLGTIFREAKQRWPFHIAAMVLLPDHLHAMLTGRTPHFIVGFGRGSIRRTGDVVIANPSAVRVKEAGE